MSTLPEFEWASPADAAAALCALIERTPPEPEPHWREDKPHTLRYRAIELLCLCTDAASIPTLLAVVLNPADDSSARYRCLRRMVRLGFRPDAEQAKALLAARAEDKEVSIPALILLERAGQRVMALDYLERVTPRLRARCLQALSYQRCDEAIPYREWLYDRWLDDDRIALAEETLHRKDPRVPWIPLNGCVAIATAERAPSRRLLAEYLPDGPVGWADGLRSWLDDRPEVRIRLVEELGWTDGLVEQLAMPAGYLRVKLGIRAYIERLRSVMEPYVCCIPKQRPEGAVDLRDRDRAEKLLEQEEPDVVAEVLTPMLLRSHDVGWAQNALRILESRHEGAAFDLARRAIAGDAPAWIPTALLEQSRLPLPERPGWLVDWGLRQDDPTAVRAALLALLRVRRNGEARSPQLPETDAPSHRLLHMALAAQQGSRAAERDLVRRALESHRWERAAALCLLGELGPERYCDVFCRALLDPVPTDTSTGFPTDTQIAGYLLAMLDEPRAWGALARFALCTGEAYDYGAVRDYFENSMVRMGVAEHELPQLPRLHRHASTLIALAQWDRICKAGKAQPM